MVLLNVTYAAKPGMGKAYVTAMEESGLWAAILKHTGCIQYEYFQSLANPDKVLLVELWADQAALDAHGASPEMVKLKAMKDDYINDTKAVRVEISE